MQKRHFGVPSITHCQDRESWRNPRRGNAEAARTVVPFWRYALANAVRQRIPFWAINASTVDLLQTRLQPA